MRNARTRAKAGLTAVALVLGSGLVAAQTGAAHADTGRPAQAAASLPEVAALGMVSKMLSSSEEVVGSGGKGKGSEHGGEGKGKGKGKGGKGKGKGKGKGGAENRT